MHPKYLSDNQTKFLLEGVNKARVLQRKVGGGKTASYLTQADVKRVLITVFGFCGWSYEVKELKCIVENDVEIKDYADGKPTGTTHPGYEVAYRAIVRLIIGDPSEPMAFYEDVAANSHTGNTLADLHDNAMKSAVSEALKRAAVNLGDQFGLSLYFNGRISPVVNRVIDWLGVSEEEQTKDEPKPDEEAAAVATSAGAGS